MLSLQKNASSGCTSAIEIHFIAFGLHRHECWNGVIHSVRLLVLRSPFTWLWWLLQVWCTMQDGKV